MIGLFVDVGALYFPVMNKYKDRISYQTILDRVKTIDKIEESFAYSHQDPTGSKNFITSIKKMGYTVKFTQNWLLHIGLDLLTLRNRINHVVLVGANQGLGRFLEVAKFDLNMSTTLIGVDIPASLEADKHIEIDEEWLDR